MLHVLGAGERMEQETKVPCSEGFSRAQAGRRPRNGGGNGSKQRDHLFAPGKAVIGRCESQSPPLVGALPPRATNRYTSKQFASHLLPPQAVVPGGEAS